MTATRKWTQLGVPHKGWTCVDIEDLGAPDHICEMCEAQEVRYVHTMEHSDYAEALRVGCICAGHMEEDLVGARKREDAFKASRSRRARWLTREWRTSRASNEYLNTDGFNVVVYPVSDGFGARIERRESGWSRISKRRYATEEHAKLAAFDAMIVAKARGARRMARTDEIRRRLVAPNRGAAMTPRSDASRIAFENLVTERLNATHPDTDPNRCAHCGRLETPGATLLPIGFGVRHTWLHSGCWEPWRERRRAGATAELAAMGIVSVRKIPDSERWAAAQIVSYPSDRCRCCRPIVFGAKWIELVNDNTRARFHFDCAPVWRAQQEAAARQAMGLDRSERP